MDAELRGGTDDHFASLRMLRPDFRIILLAQGCDPGNLLRSLSIGAWGYIFAPFSPSEIFHALSRAKEDRLALCARAEALLLRVFRSHGVDAGVAKLSGREQEIAGCLLEGLSDKAIAERLNISHHTVHVHLVRLFRKLGVHTREDIARKAFGPSLET